MRKLLINIIKSVNNTKYRRWSKLKTSHGRKKECSFVIEGHKLIVDAIIAGISIENLLVEETKLDEVINKFMDNLKLRSVASDDTKAQDIEKLIKENLIILDKTLFNELTEFEKSDGIMAISDQELEKTFKGQTMGKRVLILDRLQDPGNVGTLIRSAEAFNFKDVILVDSCDSMNYKLMRASMGSIFRINLYIASYNDLSSLITWKSDDKYSWYGADMEGEDYRKLRMVGKSAIIIGNEGRGLSDFFIKELDKKVTIPMYGQNESLNAAISGSILMANYGLE